MRDVRLNGAWLPFDPSENNDEATVADSADIDVTCESNVDCSQVVCDVSFVCVDYWRIPQCV